MPVEASHFEDLLMTHCHQTLTKQKLSNVFFLSDKEFSTLQECFEYYLPKLSNYDIAIHTFKINEQRYGIYVYHKQELQIYLQKEPVCKFLELNGFLMQDNVCDCIDCMFSNGSFSHLLGVFLGYPLNDVDGFMKGKEKKVSGVWLSYHDGKSIRKKFCAYNCMKKEICNRRKNGMSLLELVSIFN